MMHENRFGYYIYLFKHRETGEEYYRFFSPDKDVWDVQHRLYWVNHRRNRGYELVSMRKVFKDEYLNTRINIRVEEYLEQDKYEQEVRQQWKDREITDKVAIETIEMVQSHKTCLVKQMGTLIRRCQYADIEVSNEIALALYDEHLKAIRN